MRMRSGPILLLLATIAPTTWGDEGDLARFRAEYPAAAGRLEEQLARIKGSCRVTQMPSGKVNSIRTEEIKFAFDHGRELALMRRKIGTGEVVNVYGIGKEGAFWLQRAPGAKGYTVESIGIDSYDIGAYNTIFGQMAKSPFAVIGRPLTGFLAGSDPRGWKAERISKEGRSLIRVDGLGPKSGGDRLSVVFDPDAGWIIRTSELWIESARLRLLFDVEYGPPRDGLALPRLVALRNGTLETWRCEFADWKPEATPEAEFRMPYYGLPDLTTQQGASGNRLPYWLAGAAAVGLVLAYTLRRLAARRKGRIEIEARASEPPHPFQG